MEVYQSNTIIGHLFARISQQPHFWWLHKNSIQRLPSKKQIFEEKIIVILNTIKCLIPKQDCKYLLLCKIFVDEYAIQILHSVVASYLCEFWNLIVSCLFVFTFIFCWSLLVDIWSSDLAEQPSTDGADLSAHGTNNIL